MRNNPETAKGIKRLLHKLAFLGCLVAVAKPCAAQVVYTPYEEAKPILEVMSEILPTRLRNVPEAAREEAWKGWTRERDAAIRERLAQGDTDSVVNFLLFGTSFTTVPRLTSAELHSVSAQGTEQREPATNAVWQELLQRRAEDLIRGMVAPGSNERLQFSRKTLEHSGIDFSGSQSAQEARTYLYENVQRVLKEQSSFQQVLAAARSLNNPTEELAERSKLYKERGLSLDTSLPPDYALEIALKEMKDRGLLGSGKVKRVGIIGPGLDFTDKQEGYDFYPTQTVQPFAVMDSLLRLGLAKANEVEVDSLDLSPRVLAHLEHAKHDAERNRGYAIQLPRDPARRWKPQLVEYWKRFGDQVGYTLAPVAVPEALRGIALRAVRVRPEAVRRMKSFDVNVVLQRAVLPSNGKFDLLFATNILVYYDTFEQSLSLNNIAAMLTPGGYLLTNNALLELPSSEMRSVGYQTVVYSDRADDGDHIVWYQRRPNRTSSKTLP